MLMRYGDAALAAVNHATLQRVVCAGEVLNPQAWEWLHGTVLGGTGRTPLPEARVTLIDAAGNVVATATTGTDGAYAFGDLDAGEYSLVASGYPPVATQVTVGNGAAAGHQDGFDVELNHPEG